MMPLIVALLAAVWIIVLILRDALRLRRLPALASAPEPVPAPAVSIVIPARNEADNIARCLDGALGQTYGGCAVVVVDDGSTDATPRILAEFAARYPERLTVVTGRPLPPGWVGKCNACLHGAHHAAGDWLIFLDADTVPMPGLVAALVAHVRREELDAISLFPFNELPTLPERMVLPVFYQFAFTAFPLQKIVVPEAPPESAMANGQCLMVKSRAYWALGGHEVVKDKVLEDIEFAQALRRAGYRLGIATAFDQLRVRMYRNLGEIVQGLGKHASAGRRASGWRAFWAIVRLSLTLLAPPLLALGCLAALVATPRAPLTWLAAAAAVACYGAVLAFWAVRYRRWYGQPGRTAVLAPLGWLIYLFIVVRGTLQVLFRRGVTWKERTYQHIGTK